MSTASKVVCLLRDLTAGPYLGWASLPRLSWLSEPFPFRTMATGLICVTKSLMHYTVSINL